MTVVGASTGSARLPFTFSAHGGVGRLALVDLHAGPLHIERLELDVTDLGTNPGSGSAERYQRRRTRLRNLVVRAPAAALDAGIATARRHLAGLGITQVSARLAEGHVAVRARAADGLAAADVTFRIQVASTGKHLRALASHIRVHGHLPTPGPLIADRILTALLDATDVTGVVERPHVRGLCDVEIDLVGALLWHLMPPAGWRLPASSEIELQAVRIGRAAIEIAFGPPASRDVAARAALTQAAQLAAAHDLMHSADDQLRDGHVEEAMRGYRALLAAGGPDQPLLLERILALASARPAWFFDGLELARQALGQWPHFPAAHAALASILLAQGDARDAAGHLTQVAQLASAEGDDDQAALAALAGARLLRVLEPRAATQLYELALEHDPGSTEAADALADRLADELRWPELVRLLRSRAQQAQHSDPPRAVQLHLRLADVFAHQLADPGNAHVELSSARALAPDEPGVHEMSAVILAVSDPRAAVNAWREVARLAEERGDARTGARANAIVGDALARHQDLPGAERAWLRALDHDPLQADAIAGLATAAQQRGDHAGAADLFERLRGLGLPQPIVARHELALARSLVALDRVDDARGSLRRASAAGGETAAEAHAVLAEIAEATADSEHAAAELDTAITRFVDLAGDDEDDRMMTRAAELAVARASLFDRAGDAAQAGVDWERAHGLAAQHAPQIARSAARTMLERAADPIGERRWIDAVLATRPPPAERASLLISRADVRRKEATPDLAAALADIHEALSLTEEEDADPVTRRRAYGLEAELLAKSGDARARAQALASLAKMASRADRVESEAAAAAAWLAADEPAAALPHSARAHADLDPDVPSHLRREVLATLGEAAWRQRAWPDVIRAYRGLIEDSQTDLAKLGTYRYRLAVAGDRTGDAVLALRTLAALASPDEQDGSDAWAAATPELRGQALRLFADLAERTGDLAGAAAALENFAKLEGDGTPSTRADALYRAGELFRRAERGEDAVRSLEAALRISDTHLPALDALEAQWRELGDLERVATILGRKVAATARHPHRQVPLLSRLGDLQDQLGRGDVALATHQRAIEIDPAWEPSLSFVAERARGSTPKAEAASEPTGEENTASGRMKEAKATGLSLRDAARRARTAGKIGDAFASLEAANHVAPGDVEVLAELGELALELGDYPAATRHLGARIELLSGTKRGEALLELADVYYDRLDDATRGRNAMREAADCLSGTRRDSTLRLLASEASSHLAWDVASEALNAIPPERRSSSDLVNLASSFVRGGKNAEAVALIDVATSAKQFDDGGKLIAELHAEVTRKAQLARTYEWRAQGARTDEAEALRADAAALLRAIGGGDDADTEKDLAAKARRQEEALAAAITDPENEVAPAEPLEIVESGPLTDDDEDDAAPVEAPSVTVSGTREENSGAVRAAAAFADRDRLLAAHRDDPDDPGILLALLAHLGANTTAEAADLRRAILDRTALEGTGRAPAIALHELALIARGEAHDPIRATALWNKAYRVDPTYAPVWMPFADALAGADEIELARDLYDQIAQSHEYDGVRRAFASERAEALGRDDSVVSGEIGGRPIAPPAITETGVELVEARQLAEEENFPAAIVAAERAAAAHPEDREPFELLEKLYMETGDVTAASEAIGRQLVLTEDPQVRSALWRRRAKLYRGALGRDAEAYRCLKEAHACAPADPEVAYQLRTAAMVRGEWALVASLLYREIAASQNPRDRGALHLELALIFQERLDDPEQGQVNLEQALAFDPTIPAVRAPLARRYEAIGRRTDAARLYEEAATSARAADRAELLAAAARCRANIELPADERMSLAARLEQAGVVGDLEGALDLAHQLWRLDLGHPGAFRVLASSYRLSGDLPGLTELTTLRASKTDVGEERAAAWLEVARLAEDLGKFGEAARAYDLALIEEPGHTNALDARGALAFKLADWPTADLIYRDLGPGESMLGDEELALRRSIIAEHLGRDTEALELARAAAAAAPGRRDILMRIQELATRLGETALALVAARAVLDLVPLDDDEALMATQFALVDLYRTLGDLPSAIQQLERIVRDHPHHAHAIEQLAEVHVAKGDWYTATRYLYQLVPLAPSPSERADRLYQLGEAVLVHLGDVDRADDVFLRASDLDPTHVPTLRRLLDVYWRADDPAALVEVTGQLASSGSLSPGPISRTSLAQALVAAALIGDTNLATRLVQTLGDSAPGKITDALVELSRRPKGAARRLGLQNAATAIVELGKRGVLDLTKLRAAASGTAVAPELG